MSVSPASLRKVPLFADVTDDHLDELVAAFEKVELPAGSVLFEAGSTPERFLVLVDGEVALNDGDEERFRLKPIAPVGELGAITGLTRRMNATAATKVKLLAMSREALMAFCEKHGDVAFPIHYNLLNVVADKVRRDRTRLDQMRSNIITTQKAMKRMREALLEGEDTPLHKQLFDELEALIEQNKKARYLVEPSRALPTRVKLDDGSVQNVRAISRDRLHFGAAGKAASKASSDWSGVLLLGEHEIPVSGRVERVDDGQVEVKLDLLIDEYAKSLEDHLTRLQMLDVVL